MPRSKHKWYSADEKMDIIQNYLATKKEVTTFCLEVGIGKSIFYKWLKVYNDNIKGLIEEAINPRFLDVTSIIKRNIEPKVKTTMRLIISKI